MLVYLNCTSLYLPSLPSLCICQPLCIKVPAYLPLHTTDHSRKSPLQWVRYADSAAHGHAALYARDYFISQNPELVKLKFSEPLFQIIKDCNDIVVKSLLKGRTIEIIVMSKVAV